MCRERERERVRREREIVCVCEESERVCVGGRKRVVERESRCTHSILPDSQREKLE